jgi:hypothetical protein
MAVPVPSKSCCVLNHDNLFYQIQNALAFKQDMCCHLVLCLQLLRFHYAECHYTECRYAECRGALLMASNLEMARLKKSVWGLGSIRVGAVTFDQLAISPNHLNKNFVYSIKHSPPFSNHRSLASVHCLS